MGNKPDTFIQCGLNQKQPKQQTTSTREEAIRANRGQHIFKQQFKTGKSQTKISNASQSSTSIRNQHPTTKVQLTQTQPFTPSIKVQSGQRIQSKENIMINLPDHENLTKASKTPKDGYIKMVGSDFYEEMKGQCLDEIIEGRYNTTMHFPEYQIKGLLQSLVYSLAYMTKKNIPHHDFYPTRIYYSNGNFKLLNPALVNCSAYSTTQQRKRFSFLSPQLILQILNDRNQVQIEKVVMDKADVFAIGMIILEFCTLEPSSECYDPQTYSIVDSIVQERIDKASKIYNPLVGDCIDLMLQYEVEKRINPIQLAYAVHSKMRDLKHEEQNSDMSRINQNSRMTMSAKVSQQNPNQPQVLAQKMIPPNVIPPGYIIGDPKVIQGSSQNAFNQPVLVSSNNSYPMMPPFNPPNNLPPYTITSPPQYPQNYPSSLPNQNMNAFKQNVSAQSVKNIGFPQNMGFSNQNISQNPQSLKNLTIQVPSQLSNPVMQSDGSAQKKAFYVTSENSSFSDAMKKPIQQIPGSYTTSPYPLPSNKTNNLSINNFSNTPYLASTSSIPSSTLKQKSDILSPNSKIKLNPFEQIEQDFKQDEDQSPMVDKYSYNKVQKQSETTSESKPSAYTFRTTQPSTGNTISSYSSSTSYASQAKEQTLDERVRKILQASKNIK